ALANDGRHVAQGLDVVDAGRFAPDADSSREGRLGARVGATAFQRVDQRGFFAANVATGAGVHEQLEIEAAAEDVTAQQTGSLGFGDGAIEVGGGVDVLAAQEDVAAVGLERARGDQHAFHQQVWQLLHEQAVLPGVRLHFVRVAQQVADVHGFVGRHQAPLHAGGEARAAAALETGVLDRLYDVGLSHFAEGLARGGVTVLRLVLLQPYRLGVVAQAPGQRVGFFAAGDTV